MGLEREYGPLPDGFRSEKHLAQLEHNSIITARGSDVSPKVIAAYGKFALGFVHTSAPQEPFIIGSAIMCHSNGLSLWPLSSGVALGLCATGTSDPWIIRIDNKNKEIVRQANLSMAKGSRWGIGGNSRKQIKRLSKFIPKSA